MVVAIGLGLLLVALGGAAYFSVHRRWIRTRTVRRVRASLALWMGDPAAPLRPAVAVMGAVAGTTPQGPGPTPDVLVPAVRRHFVLNQDGIERYHRRTA